LHVKRDLDLIRELLLRLEAMPLQPGQVIFLYPGNFSIDDHAWDEIKYHFALLEEAKLITNLGKWSGRGDLSFSRLTSAGHDYVDTIRDPKIWAKTKKGLESVGGWTLELVGRLAKGLVDKQIERLTGVKLP